MNTLNQFKPSKIIKSSILHITKRTKISYNQRIPSSRYVLKNIPHTILASEIKELFTKKVPIHEISIPRNKDDPTKHKGLAILKLDTEMVPVLLKLFQGYKFQGKKLELREFVDTDKGKNNEK